MCIYTYKKHPLVCWAAWHWFLTRRDTSEQASKQLIAFVFLKIAFCLDEDVLTSTVRQRTAAATCRLLENIARLGSIWA